MSEKPTQAQLQEQLDAAQETIKALSKRMRQLEGCGLHSPFQQQLQSYQRRITAKANELEEAKNWSELIIQHAMDAIVRLDQQGTIQSWNPMAERMFGYSKSEVLGKLMEDILIPGRLHDTHLKNFNRHLQRGRGALMNRRVEGVAQCKDGSELPIEFVASFVQQGDKPSFVMVLRDISERKAAEQQLRESHARLESLVEARTAEVRDLASIIEVTLNLVGVSDLQGNVLYINPAGKKMLGLPPDQAPDTLELGRFHSPETHHFLVNEVFPSVLEQGVLEVKCEFLDQDACPIPTMSLFMSLPDRPGAPSRMAVIARDLRQEIALRQQIEHVDRLESLGVLAGGIAHDFNNILSAIIGNAGLARRKLDADSPGQKHLESIEQSSMQAANLCKQMLAYSGKGKLIIQPVNLSDLIGDMRSLLEVSTDKNVNLTFDLRQPLPAVDADITQIQQILMNLVINASEAIDKHNGVIIVSTGVMDVDDGYLQRSIHQQDVLPGSFVYLEVSDSGCGMDEATRKKIFDPFFTTKFTGRGLGMSAVLGIVHGHQGVLHLNSEPGQGATFRIALPLSASGEVQPGRQAEKAPVRGKSGLILVIDDEETIREVACMLLTEMGFDVITAADGQEGVAVFQQQGKVTGVILDMTMPRMGGEACYHALRELDPDIKVILSSGYSAEDATACFQGQGLAGFIQKPYLIDAFQDMVIRCFSDASGNQG